MKTIKIFLLAIFISGLLLRANGQTEKGKFIIGAGSNLSLNFQNRKDLDFGTKGPSDITFSVNPSGGYFITNNLAGGIELLYSAYSSKTAASNYISGTYGIGPFLKYYLGKRKIKPFVRAGMEFSRFHSKIKGSGFAGVMKGFDNTIDYAFDAGIACFINNKISIDAGIGYNSFTRNFHYGTPLSKQRVQNIGYGLTFNYLIL